MNRPYDELDRLQARLRILLDEANTTIDAKNKEIAALKQAQDQAKEGAKIIDKLIGGIASHGQYSVVSTLNFLRQARESLAPPALPASSELTARPA